MAFFKYTYNALVLLWATICFVHTSEGAEIPALIWGVESLSENLPSISALETVSTRTFENEFIKKNIKAKNLFVIFVEDKLSMEDFSVYDEQKETGRQIALSNIKSYIKAGPSVFLSRVQNPVIVIDDLSEHYKTQVIKYNTDMPVERQLPKSLHDVDVMVVHLPTVYSKNRFDALRNSDNIISKVLEALKAKKAPVIATYFGRKPSWDSSEVEHFKSRKFLAAVEQIDGFVNVSGCLFYAANATLSFTDKTKNDTFSERLPFPTPTDDTKCENKSSLLVLEYSGEHKVKLSLNFTRDSKSWWSLYNTFVDIDDRSSIELTDKDIGAPTRFSYSCYSSILRTKNTSDPFQVLLKYDRMQIDPFASNQDKFSDSFDCTPFFTIPIFMGLIMMCVFTALLAFGVYAMMDIKTMDRFDDPRGKMISVPTAE